MLWETPPLPWPFELAVDGRAVEEAVVRGFLEPEWNRFFLTEWEEPDAAGVLTAEAAFYTDAAALLEPLVRGVVLLREAERRFPEVPAEDLEVFRAAFAADAGGVYTAMLAQHGEEYVLAHLRRQWRLRRIEEEFAADVPPVTEAEARQAYAALLAGDQFDDEERARAPSFEQMRARMFSTLAAQRRNRDIEAWVDAQRAGAEAEARLPDGRSIRLRP